HDGKHGREGCRCDRGHESSQRPRLRAEKGRAGCFDRDICLGVPDSAARARILQVMCSKMTLSGNVDFHLISKKTPGFVGA
ncbi:unnamed protein product, partial [Ascophyllum nodosum]